MDNLTTHDNHEALQENQKNELQGIGGWLIVILVGLCISVVTTFSSIVIIIMSNQTISVVMIYFLIYVFLITAMIKKHYVFPKAYFIFLIAANLFSILQYIFLDPYETILSSLSASSDPRYIDFMTDLMTIIYIIILTISVICTVLWSIYLIRSNRVRNTFIHNWKGAIAKEKKVIL